MIKVKDDRQKWREDTDNRRLVILKTHIMPNELIKVFPKS